MSWDAIGAIAELLGAVGVIASLLYLARQMRDNAAQNRRAAVQAVLTKLDEVHASMTASEQFTEVWVRGGVTMTHLDNQVEAVQFSSCCQRLFRAYEELVQYRKAGWVDDWAWGSVRLFFLPVAEMPGVLEWWAKRRTWFLDDFRAHLESSLSAEAAAQVEVFTRDLDGADFPSGQIMGPAFEKAAQSQEGGD